MSERVKTRSWAKALPPVVWALGIDALDAVSAPVTSVFPVLGEPMGLIVDVGQGMLSFFVFDDIRMWGATAAELALPSTGFLDVFPSYTAMYFAINMKVI